MRNGSRRARTREVALIGLLMVAVCILAGWLALRFAAPPPPSTFVISAANKGSPYYVLASKYAQTFARNGITLDIRESGGSLDNIKALTNPDSDVDAAFVQGGLITTEQAQGLMSAGRVSYEPLWVFHHTGSPFERLSELKGKRVLVGPPGSGTNALATRLLAANGVTPDNTTLLARALPDYVDLLNDHEADAGFLVLGAQARTIQRLLHAPNVRLLDLANAESYVQKYEFLTRLDLREGLFDLGNRIPPTDTKLVATSAAIVVKETAHPALVNLLAQAMLDVHNRPNVASDDGSSDPFQRVGSFPTASDPEFPMAKEAVRVYRSGAPFLQRYVPFWLATLIDRLVVSALVALPLIYPIFRFAPVLYRWSIRRRILHWYGVLKQVEADIKRTPSAEERATKISEIDRIEAAVDDIPVPLEFTDQHFELRQHIDAVRTRLVNAQARYKSQAALVS